MWCTFMYWYRFHRKFWSRTLYEPIFENGTVLSKNVFFAKAVKNHYMHGNGDFSCFYTSLWPKTYKNAHFDRNVANLGVCSSVKTD